MYPVEGMLVERNGYRHKLSGVRLNMVKLPKSKEETPVQKISIPTLVYDPLFGVKMKFVTVGEQSV